MSYPHSDSRLLDNHSRAAVGDFLKERIRPESKLSVVSAYFTIYAYQALREVLEGASSMRFLFGEPQFINTLDPNRDSAPAFKIENDELRLTERLEQSRIARECANWIKHKVEVRSIRYPGFLHGKMYHIQQGDYVQAVLGSSNFTTRGLGLSEPKNIELNFRITDQLDQEDLKAWFDPKYLTKV